MKCEICGKDTSNITVLLPKKQEDGKLDTMVCLECARKSGAYCKKHEAPHLGFEDGTTACKLCIEEVVIQKRNETSGGFAAVPETARIFCLLREALPPKEFEEFVDESTLDGRIIGSAIDLTIVRFIATKALRTGQSFEAVLEKVVADQKADYLFS